MKYSTIYKMVRTSPKQSKDLHIPIDTDVINCAYYKSCTRTMKRCGKTCEHYKEKKHGRI